MCDHLVHSKVYNSSVYFWLRYWSLNLANCCGRSVQKQSAPESMIVFQSSGPSTGVTSLSIQTLTIWPFLWNLFTTSRVAAEVWMFTPQSHAWVTSAPGRTSVIFLVCKYIILTCYSGTKKLWRLVYISRMSWSNDEMKQNYFKSYDFPKLDWSLWWRVSTNASLL